MKDYGPTLSEIENDPILIGAIVGENADLKRENSKLMEAIKSAYEIVDGLEDKGLNEVSQGIEDIKDIFYFIVNGPEDDL